MLSRSVTPSPTTPTKSRLGLPTRLVKTNSSPNMHEPSMAAAAAAAAASTSGTPPHQTVSAMRDDHVMDTRTPSPVLRPPNANSPNGGYQPDLSAEVAMLSTKLVNAINYQTTLDDSLQQARHELEQSRRHCQALLTEKQQWDSKITNGVLMKKAEVDQTIAQLRAELANERAAREESEKSRKQTEGELENLTSALFEEANTMVAAARKDAEAVEKRNSQLRSQLNDTELLLASQQEQLQDLKATMERLQSEAPTGWEPSVPSTPVTSVAAGFDPLHYSPSVLNVTDISPEHPLHFTHLLSPVMRNDTLAFTEFQDLLSSRKGSVHSRTSSNNANTSNSSVPPSSSSGGSLGSVMTTSPAAPGTFSFSANSSPSSTTFTSANSGPPLKESKFYKRALTEDIEPTLRLDLAPGLSFLSRRAVLSSLLLGTLAVEPFPTSKHYYACALCGESRATETHTRNHRFRTSEDDQVPKPLCDYCLGRLRATCDYVGFLRMVRDGFWKNDGEEDQKAAWEESVRLRERMFWSRLGGGVVPSQPQAPRTVPATPSTNGMKSERPSLESIPELKEGRSGNAINASEHELPTERPDGDQSAHFDGNSAILTSKTQEPTRSSGREAVFTTPPPTEPDEASLSNEETHGPLSPASKLHEGATSDLDARFSTSPLAHGSHDSTNDPGKSLQEVSDGLEESSQQPTPRLRSPMPERNSLIVERPLLADRRVSSVLARVRAMEAAESGIKPPGSFE